MVVDVIELIIASFHDVVQNLFYPLMVYFNLMDLVVGFFLTYSFYRFIIGPLFGGHLKFTFPRGSDQADKKYHGLEHGKGK